MEAARSFAATATSSAPQLGCQHIANTLYALGVRHVMGVVGIPVTELAIAIRAAGIHFYSFRNEQSASYAASCMGYLTQTPGVCLTVAGPGMIHALAGVGNAQINNWPLLLLSGAVATPELGMGAFQESPQLQAIQPLVKHATRLTSLSKTTETLEYALCVAAQGRPGPTYVELPADILHQRIDPNMVLPTCTLLPSPSITLPHINALKQALSLLSQASRPLVIIGKGAAYARAEQALRTFIDKTGIPFLATPMGKGVVPDSHPLSTATSRSTALSHADIILIIGARLNWILHFGTRFISTAKLIRIDIDSNDIHQNRRADIPLVGDARATVEALNQLTHAYTWPKYEIWKQTLCKDGEKNRQVTKKLLADDSNPMSYYRAYRDILAILPSDAIVVNEGANTMDIGRTLIPHDYPRHRLDAGTWATMGIGVGYAIAAQIVHPKKKIVAIQGDSAFGFSAMELETCCRLRLPILFIIINNNGIYYGLEHNPSDPHAIPVTSLTCNARYEMIATAFAGYGYYVDHPSQLLSTLQKAMSHHDQVCVVNVMIRPEAERKKQSHGWLSDANTSAAALAQQPKSKL